MIKNLCYWIVLACFLAGCAPITPTQTPVTATMTPAVKPTLVPQASPTVVNTKAAPTVNPSRSPDLSALTVDELVEIIYASDPTLPQYDPVSKAYAEFENALKELSSRGPEAIDGASAMAYAIAYPRQDANLAAQALLSLGPEIGSTTLPILIGHLRDVRAEPRLYSLMVVSRLDEKAACAVGEIGPLLWDTDASVRFMAAYSIEKLTGKEVLPKEARVKPEPLTPDSILSDMPEGKLTGKARSWWTQEGSKTDWHSAYGMCDD
jgi:hypothetical protein